MIFFDRQTMPTNLLTVSDWRIFAKHTTDWMKSIRITGRSTWERAARCYAHERGYAIALLADGSLVHFEKRGKSVARSTYRPGKWGWS